jgi:hypothetical protein
MASFDSPIGKKKFGGPQMRELDVPDESEYSGGPPLENGEPVVRRRPVPQVNPDQIRDFQARMQREEMPVYERDPAEVEREIRQAREDKKAGRERLSDGAKRRIEMLVGMTRGTRSVDIEGNIFVLRTLRSKEMMEALMFASQFDGTVRSPFEIRRQLLARSITQIAGVSTEQFIGSVEVDAKCAFIDELDESLLNRLYDEYLTLVRESKEKYAVKNEDEVKEVLGDLKK